MTDLTGIAPESWRCTDCGFDTAPGFPSRIQLQQMFNARNVRSEEMRVKLRYGENTEVYHVRKKVWVAAGMGSQGGCLCIGCLEKRIKRRLKPEDFPRKHPFNSLPGTDRLLDRRGEY